MHGSAESRLVARYERRLREAEERLRRQTALIKTLHNTDARSNIEEAERLLGKIRHSVELARNELARARAPRIA